MSHWGLDAIKKYRPLACLSAETEATISCATRTPRPSRACLFEDFGCTSLGLRLQHLPLRGEPMRTILYGVLGFTMTWIGLVAADKAPLTAQAQQGREIFQ